MSDVPWTPPPPPPGELLDERLAAYRHLARAAVCLAEAHQPIQQRVATALVQLLPVYPRCLPPELQEGLRRIRTAMAPPGPVAASVGSIVTATKGMDEDTARAVATTIASLIEAAKDPRGARAE